MWFPEEERARAMAISGLMAPLGSLLGLGLAGIIIIGLDVNDPIECMNHLKKIVYAQNTIFTVTVALLLILIREKPVDPPSKTALTFRVLSQTGIKEDIQTLSGIRNFKLIATAFVLMWGNFIGLGNQLTPLFSSQFSPALISLIGASFVVAGVIGCFCMGLFIDKTQKHLFGIRGLAIAVMVSISLCTAFFPLGSLPVTVTIVALLGIFTVPILPSSYAFVSKITPGMAPSVVNGLMMSGAQLYSFFGSLVATWMLSYGQRIGLGWTVFTQTIALLCTLCIKYEPQAEFSIYAHEIRFDS